MLAIYFNVRKTAHALIADVVAVCVINCRILQAESSESAQNLAEDEWVGEAYESDAEGTLHKFQKHVQRCPSQCVRYGYVHVVTE